VTVKEVNHIRCFAIDIAKYLILLSCRLAMELDDFGRSKIYIIDHNPSWRIKNKKERVFGFILFKYICTLIYKQYENNEKM
jgi:hypothetical protein